MPESASQKFEEEARLWEETGTLGWSGQNEYAFAKMRLWSRSDGAEREGVSERLKRYIVAAEAPFQRREPDWYAYFLGKRDYCSLCGESYQLGNLRFCTHCTAQFCYCSFVAEAPNGNRRCPVCAMGELVG